MVLLATAALLALVRGPALVTALRVPLTLVSLVSLVGSGPLASALLAALGPLALIRTALGTVTLVLGPLGLGPLGLRAFGLGLLAGG